MCACQPGVNLRDYVSLHPPEVTFFLCLLSLAVSLLCLRFYGQTHTLPNPDIATDWNRLLSSLAEFQLCADANSSVAAAAASWTAPPPPQDPTEAGPTGDTLLHRRVPLVVGAASAPLEELSLHTEVTASQLGLPGNASVSVTVHVLSEAEGKGTYTCLTISGPTHLLPLDLLPPECPRTENVPPTVVHLVTLTPSTGPPPAAPQSCFSLQSHHDPALTVMLTQEDQEVAGRHLLESSGCLLGVCLLFCLYASLRRSPRRHPGNAVDRHICTQPLVDPDH
ncbi:insulin-like growth factor-binding protein 3 receptor [Gadus chalcogrammus]|uniref:insulin-like growth factor-binding protein 3 receptor n=1 Tax=Gadus chalcogrammus TaxID=1042646 RepID=UPI0024C49636|nr:insulin-like growth factor-binding protein 3 receptor [Gadus chalcogrammus]XP_056457522.1 insulin-like growth factor-binding protein 3 receptor [Gadus chalcogrammus]